MPNFMTVARTEELPEGALKEVSVQGREILLAKARDKYYAADNRCPHLGGKLSQGKLAGTVITCPRHGSQFDLTDGRVILWTNWSRLLAKVSQG